MQPFTPLRPKPADYVPRRDSIPRGTVHPVRTNITRACNSCRSRKIKCDGQKPTCSHCATLQTECIYDLSKDKRKKEGWKTLVNDLQRRNRELEETLSLLKCNSSADAMERLQLLRGDQQQLPSFTDEEGASGSSASFSHHSSSKHGSEERRSSSSSRPTRPPLVTWGSSETLRSRYDMSVFSIDDPSSINASILPPEEVTRQATSSSFPCAAAYFYVMSPDACDDLTTRIYDQSISSSKSDFCQLCAIAATGAKYCTDGIPDSTCRAYFQLATLLLQDSVEENPLAAMRVCVCLSVYLILDKLTSARVMLATGFSIARSGMPKSIGSDSDADSVEWARVFRTIAFTDCLLASTLGYTTDLRLDEISLLESLAATESISNPLGTPNEHLLSWQIFKITHISAQIDVRMRHPALLTEHELHLLSTKLDSWLNELPPSLSLVAACQDASIPKMMPILLMHLVNIATRVTFYERVIRLNLDTSDKSGLHQVVSLPGDICDIYAGFAQQLTRVVALFNENHCVIKNCWITIHSCYHAALGLLLRALQHLALGNSCDSLENLSSAYICVEALGTCSEKDVAAMRLLNRIAPLYHRMKRIADNLEVSEQGSPTQQSEMSAADRSEVDDVASELVAGIKMHVEEPWIR